MEKYVIVAGNIGVGKTTLVSLLCQRLGWQPFAEGVNDNPYLPDFYEDMLRWGFHSQIFFLANRLRDQRQLLAQTGSVLQDRAIYEDAEIFARNLQARGRMSDRDFETYRRLYEAILPFLPTPDLVLYLRASVDTLRQRIARRGRDFERTIPDEYLTDLNALYARWIDNFRLCPVLTVPADALDFVNHTDHLDLIASRMLDKLEGKEEVSFEDY
jgi:deoxyadenosine/deoxycytidine kinase